MEEINYLLRMLTVSQIVLLTSYFAIYERHRAGILAAICALSFICYLILPFIFDKKSEWWLQPILIFALTIPSSLWLIAKWFFCDERAIPSWLIPLTLFYVATWLTPDMRQSTLIPHEELRRLLFSLAPQLIKLGLVAHVVYMAVEGLSTDLVDQRRKLRVILAIGAGSLTALVIVVEIWADGSVPLLLELLGSVLMMILALAINLYLLGLRANSSLKPIIAAQAQTRKTEPDTMLAEKIIAAMTENRFYATPGLTLADLAAHLKVPVHQARNTINQSLGHRNFNQFLNHYRIQEAARRLLEERKLPILSIALDTGFKSLSSFNIAFRQRHNMTPTEWRNQHD